MRAIAAEWSSGLTSDPRVPGSNPAAGGDGWWLNARALWCWVINESDWPSGLALSPELVLGHWDWGSCWFPCSMPAAVSSANPLGSVSQDKIPGTRSVPRWLQGWRATWAEWYRASRKRSYPKADPRKWLGAQQKKNDSVRPASVTELPNFYFII